MWAWLERLRFKWGGLPGAGMTLNGFGVPVEQHRQMTEAERFQAERGFGMATAPDEWTEDIAKHNAALQAEYAEEVERRKAAYRDGTYRPRFYLTVENEDGTFNVLPEVNWDLEMALLPGRRTDVTHERLENLPLYAPKAVREQMAVDAMKRVVSTAEQRDDILKLGHIGDIRDVHRDQNGHIIIPARRTVRDLIGSREAILLAVNGNALMADQIEEHARTMFGVVDLDEPLPVTAP